MKKLLLGLLIIVLVVLGVLYFTGSFKGLTATLDLGRIPTADTTQCGYQWATQPLPEVTQKLQDRLAKADLPAMDVRAGAYGENCVLSDGSIDHFAAKQTDLYFTVTVADTADEQALSDLTEKIITFVEKIPANTLLGPNEGYIQINFTSHPAGMLSLWFQASAGRAAIDQGLHGADLLAKLLNR